MDLHVSVLELQVCVTSDQSLCAFWVPELMTSCYSASTSTECLPNTLFVIFSFFSSVITLNAFLSFFFLSLSLFFFFQKRSLYIALANLELVM